MFAPTILAFDPQSGGIAGCNATERYLGDLANAFADGKAVQAALTLDNPLIYRATQVEDRSGEGDVHYGIAIIYPGKVGNEYHLTKGHIHAWRPAAEVYICLGGEGMMLMENERTGECLAAPLQRNHTLYVPGYMAHRTINIGSEPLVYWGILSCRAGHDYGAIGERNFRQVVVEIDGKPTVMERSDYLRLIQ
ncbi:MAG: glucose-6-phosphate isomerase family protein [Caldilineaceae bacterium]